METVTTSARPLVLREPITDCPLTAAVTAIGGKWNLICLYWLDSGKRRFNVLRRLMPDISHKVLSETLRSLEEEGLVTRTIYPEVPPRVEYSISEHGQTLRPLMEAVRVWGRSHIEWLTEAKKRL